MNLAIVSVGHFIVGWLLAFFGVCLALYTSIFLWMLYKGREANRALEQRAREAERASSEETWRPLARRVASASKRAAQKTNKKIAVALRLKESPPQCPLCREDADHGVRCPGCDVVVHEACAEEMTSSVCPTFACGVSLKAKFGSRVVQ